MHWLAEQLGQLHALASRHRQYKELSEKNVAGSADAEKQARTAFLSSVHELVQEISRRQGVEACFAAHEGLLVEIGGQLAEFEALGAMAASCIQAAEKAADSLALGEMNQMVIIGERQKLALFAVGGMALGILAKSSTGLAQVLSR